MKKNFIDFIKKNYLLGITYPTFILINLFFLKEYKAQNLLHLFIIINLTNQFDIGFIKNSFFNNEKYNIKLFFFFLASGMLVFSFISFGIIKLFKMVFELEYLFIIFIGLLANEFKSYQDSKSNFFKGFSIKNSLNLSVVFIFLHVEISNVFYFLFTVSAFLLAFFFVLYNKLQLVINHKLKTSDFKFFTLNIFTFISGNVDRFLVIPFIGQPLLNNYLYYSETNAKLNGLFGFLNNLFLYKKLKLTRIIILIVSLFLIATVMVIFILFNMNEAYLIYSFSLIVSVFSQYYIFSKIGHLKGLSTSLFPIFGMSFYLFFFFIFNSFFQLSILTLTATIIVKSVSEMLFILYLVRKR